MAMYIGNPSGISGGGSVGPITSGPYTQGGGNLRVTPPSPSLPWQPPKPPGPTVFQQSSQRPNVLGAESVRPTGPSAGFDPAYLQNLATAIGGLFSRPQGNLSFNPLGNLSDISSPGLGFGNAPSPGLPSTMLQDAINGLAFMFNPPAATPGGGSPMAGGNNGGRNNGGRGGYPIF